MADKARNLLLANKWDESVDPKGWWMSEKLDGVRAYWTGKTFYSRQGNVFDAPKWFTKDLPDSPLDGELWCGRGLFQKCLSIVKQQKHSTEKEWKYVTYLVFDAPSHGGAYEERVGYLKDTIKKDKDTSYAAVVGIQKCEGLKHLKATLKDVLKKGGEGIMLRKAKSLYETSRSDTLLKVKFFHDEEARVTGTEKGKGRLQDLMGKLNVELPNGVKFKVGTGFTDAQRRKPPKKGSIITFKYQELSNAGVPRFPVFLHERPELTWEDVIANAKTKVPWSQVKQNKKELKKQHSILFSTVPSRDQISGKKMVTDDDVDAEDVEDEKVDDDDDGGKKKKGGKKAKTTQTPCKYGAACYRLETSHLTRFAHPPKHSKPAGYDEWKAEDDAKKKGKKNKNDDDDDNDNGDKQDDDNKDGGGGDKDLDKDKDNNDDDDDGGDKKGKKKKKMPSKKGGKKSKTDDDDGGDGENNDAPNAGDADDEGGDDDDGKKGKGKKPKAGAGMTGVKGSKKKPMCMFGADCYRTSPLHLDQYAHPKKGKKVEISDEDIAAMKAGVSVDDVNLDDYYTFADDSGDEDRAKSGKDLKPEWGIGSDDDDDDEKKSSKKKKDPESSSSSSSKKKHKKNDPSSSKTNNGDTKDDNDNVNGGSGAGDGDDAGKKRAKKDNNDKDSKDPSSDQDNKKTPKKGRKSNRSKKGKNSNDDDASATSAPATTSPPSSSKSRKRKQSSSDHEGGDGGGGDKSDSEKKTDGGDGGGGGDDETNKGGRRKSQRKRKSSMKGQESSSAPPKGEEMVQISRKDFEKMQAMLEAAQNVTAVAKKKRKSR